MATYSFGEEAENSVRGQLLSKYMLQGTVLLPSLHPQVHFHLSPSFHKTTKLDRRSAKDLPSSLHTQFECQAAAGTGLFSLPQPPFHATSPQETSCLGDRGGLLSLLAITETTDGDKEVGFSNFC